MTELLRAFVEVADGLLIWYFAALNLFYALLMLISLLETAQNWSIASRLRLTERLPDDAFPPLSILVPAYNEETTIVESVRTQLELDYPSHEVVVINDGSDDGTLERLRDAFDLYRVPPAFPRQLETRRVRSYYRSRSHPALLVIDKDNGGKADALNAGLNAARYPYCTTVDADTLVEKSALRRISRAFLLPGAPVAGAGGTIRVANDCRFRDGEPVDTRVPSSTLAAIQVPEYLRAFLFGRLGFNRLGGNLLVSGAFSLYRKSTLIEIGGFRTGSVTEDLEVTVKLHESLRERGIDYSLPFVPDPMAWTEVPEDTRTLGNQRERWHRGLIVTLLEHIHMLFNPRYGKIGMIVFPFYFFGEMLAPVVEVVGYVAVGAGLALGVISWEFALLFLAMALGYLMMLAVWAVWLDMLTFRVYPRLSDYAKLVGYAMLEPFGFRQMTVWWRLKAFWNVVREVGSWGEMKRGGLAAEPGSSEGS